MDVHEEIEAVCRFEGRRPGGDAERRVARHLERRLRELGREVETEPIEVWPRWAPTHALLALAAVGGSLLSVEVELAGLLLVAVASVLAFGEATGLFRPLRRLFGRRASQNVVSGEEGDKPGVLVLVAHTDAGRAGAIFGRGLQERLAALGRRLGRPIGPFEPFMAAMLVLVACCALRLAGIEGTALTAVQFVPTVILIVAIVLLLDVALSATVPGASDNASGVATVLRLGERFGGRLEHFDLWLLFTGSQEAFGLGMRAFLRRHRKALDSERAVFVNVDEVGAGTIRYSSREGLLLAGRSHPQLRQICEEIAEDDGPGGAYSARPLALRSPTDAAVARSRGFPAITVTCRNAVDYAPHHHQPTDTPGRVDGDTLDRAFGFVAELVERLDGQIGPDLGQGRPAVAEETGR